jgi:muconolactone delta-isomerase
MKKRTINFNLPATLSFSAENNNENELFSRGKLKVFYKGETADHRLFSDDFSENLVKSLPYTPIVSHYDEEKDDFVGHATNQDIYGIVDPCGEITFEKMEDGNI